PAAGPEAGGQRGRLTPVARSARTPLRRWCRAGSGPGEPVPKVGEGRPEIDDRPANGLAPAAPGRHAVQRQAMDQISLAGLRGDLDPRTACEDGAPRRVITVGEVDRRPILGIDPCEGAHEGPAHDLVRSLP